MLAQRLHGVDAEEPLLEARAARRMLWGLIRRLNERTADSSQIL